MFSIKIDITNLYFVQLRSDLMEISLKKEQLTHIYGNKVHNMLYPMNSCGMTQKAVYDKQEILVIVLEMEKYKM